MPEPRKLRVFLCHSSNDKPAVRELYGRTKSAPFANQALAAEYIVKHHDELEAKVYSVPEDIDNEIARLKLEAMGVGIDVLTDQQVKYLNSWEEGT